MKLLGFNRVLCLSPHPDDVEYSMAGSILKYFDTKFDILCLTQGGDCDVTTSSKRLREVEVCWEQLTTCTNVGLYFTPVKFLKDWTEDKWVNYIENNFLNDENNSPMKNHGQRTLMFLNASVKSLIEEHKPKYVSVERL